MTRSLRQERIDRAFNVFSWCFGMLLILGILWYTAWPLLKRDFQYLKQYHAARNK